MKKIVWIIINLFFLTGWLYSIAQPRNLKSRQEWEEFFDNKDTRDNLEGIYGVSIMSKTTISIGNESQNSESSKQNIYEYIIVRNENSNHYYDVYINIKDWGENSNIVKNPEINSIFNSLEILDEKIRISPTAVSGVFLISKYQQTKFKNSVETTNESYNLIQKSPGLLEYVETSKIYREANGFQITVQGVSTYLLLKNYPIDIVGSNNNLKSYGTCFAIGNNGFLITNSHVIDNKRKIVVKGINGNSDEGFEATVVKNDLTLDIAILRIADTRFKGFKKSPIVISPTISDIGTSIYVLGYPLRSTMGEEIKLTNGIISSQSGFKNDPNSYQISAPIQPGSSGGPVFDNKGFLIGIINAKHRGTENVSYAVKVSHLKNLLGKVYPKPNLPIVNSLRDKPLTEQMKELRNFVFVIEAE